MHGKIKDHLISYSFLTPFLVFFIGFVLIPIGYVFYLSFQNGSFLDQAFEWAGISNFVKVLKNADFQNAFYNSLIYIVVEVPACQILTLLIALLIRRKTRVNAFFESVLFLPMLISMVAASVVIAYVLSNNGPVNFLLGTLGIPAVNWLGEAFTARISVMILELWKGGTFFIFVYMSALRSLPVECSEAARIDGASVLQETFLVTLPLLKNSIVLCVVMNTIWQFQIFESVYMLTGGGPLKATETVVYTVYQYSFMFGKIGSGAAGSVLFLLVIALISIMEMLLFRSKDEGGKAGETT